MTNVIQNGVDAISLGSLYALIALGIALIFGIMRLINFAHGELITAGAYAAYVLSNPPWALLIIVPVLVSAGFALAMERAAFRPVRGASPATLLVTSFALSYFLQNLALLVFGAFPRGVPLPTLVTEQFFVGDLRIPKLNVITLITTFVLLVGLVIFLKRTVLGIRMRAAAENFRMARLLGVRADTVIASAFLISGLLAGAVSILFVSQLGTVNPTMGLAPVLVGLVATVIGGMGNLPAAVLGGYILGGLTVGLDAGLPEGLRVFRDAFVFGTVIFILLLRPQGLLGSRAAKVRV